MTHRSLAGVSLVGHDRHAWRLGSLVRLVRFGPLLILVVFAAAMAMLSPYFLDSRNLSNMALAWAIPASLAIGQFFVVVTGEIDLSAAASYALTGVVGGWFMTSVLHDGVLTILVMLATGALIGVVNGILVIYLRLSSSFIVTLAMFSLLTSCVYLISDGLTVTGFPEPIRVIGGDSVAGVPIAAIVVVGLVFISVIASLRLRWGRWVYAVGSNSEAAARVGLPVRAVRMSVFVISGVSAAVAGVFEAGLTNAATPVIGFNALINAITAVVIGGVALTGGRGTIIGAMTGSVIILVVNNGLNLLSIDANWVPFVLGIVLLSALGIERVRSQLETNLRLDLARRAGDL